MGGNAEPAQPGDVFRHRVGIAAEPARRRRQAERHIVPWFVLTSTPSTHSTPWMYSGGSGACAVAVVGEDREVQAGVRRGERDPLAIESSVRLNRVDVKGATQRLPRGIGCGRRGQRTRWSGDEYKDGGREGRRQDRHDQQSARPSHRSGSNATMRARQIRRRRAGRSPCRFAPR